MKGKYLIGILLFFLTAPNLLFGYQFDPPWTNLDSITLDFSVYDTNLPAVNNVDVFSHSGWGYVAFEDTDNSGNLSVGDKFTDYVVYYLTVFEDAFGNYITITGLNNTWQVAFEAILEGHVSSLTGSENFVFDKLNEAHLYVDSTTDGDGLTLGGFDSSTKLGYFLDGGELLTGTHLVHGAAAGNNGYLAFGANGEGKYQVAAEVVEGTDGAGFLKDDTGTNLYDIWEHIAIYSDGDLTRWDPNSSIHQQIASAFQSYYGLPASPFDFSYTLSNQKGSADFAAVPEPATLLLFGSSILSLAGIFRKRQG